MFNVLTASHKAQVKRVIYAASSSCYGIQDIYPTPEQAEIRPMYPYALTKRLGEELAMHWEQVYGLPVLSLRFFNVYGPRSRTSGTYGAVFGVFLAQKLAGHPCTIVGDGEQTRDFTCVSDIVEALMQAAMSNRSGRIYNVGRGVSVSVNRLAILLAGAKIHIPKRTGEPDHTCADIGRVEAELGWKSQVSIECGVQNILQHIDYWRDAPIWTPENIAEATADWFKFLGDDA